MSRELWATYSVKDHLDPRALAVDVMLFDRLVFPVPEDGYFPENSGSPIEIGPVEWKRNDKEWARWQANEWDPSAQSKLLELLRPVIRKVSWDSEGQIEAKYREEAARLAASGLPDYAFQATRTTLTRDLPAYVDGVAAVGPSYRNFSEFERECASRDLGATQPLPGEAVATVLASRFFVPDVSDDRIPDESLLSETVKFVTGDAEFRRRRTAFIEWRQKFIRNGATDPESIKRAVEEMRELLDAANAATNKLRVRKIARYLFQLAPAALGIADIGLGGGGLVSAVGGAFASVGSIAVDEKVFKSSQLALPAHVAFVHDARRHFGWK